MKINDAQRIGVLRTYAQQAGHRPGQAAGQQRKDEVQISAQAKEMLGAQGATDPERLRRIETLKLEVSSGTYHVDAGKIAEKLLPFLT